MPPYRVVELSRLDSDSAEPLLLNTLAMPKRALFTTGTALFFYKHRPFAAKRGPIARPSPRPIAAFPRYCCLSCTCTCARSEENTTVVPVGRIRYHTAPPYDIPIFKARPMKTLHDEDKEAASHVNIEYSRKVCVFRRLSGEIVGSMISTSIDRSIERSIKSAFAIQHQHDTLSLCCGQVDRAYQIGVPHGTLCDLRPLRRKGLVHLHLALAHGGKQPSPGRIFLERSHV